MRLTTFGRFALLLIYSVSIACNPSSDQNVLQGTLGELDATLQLTVNGDQVEGAFSYIDTTIRKEAIPVRGLLHGNQLTLSEFVSENGNSSGVFVGKYFVESYTGFWHSPNGDKFVPFTFSNADNIQPNSLTRSRNTEITYIMTHQSDIPSLWGGIEAKIGTKTYEIIPFNPEPTNSDEWEAACLSMITTADFNGNGYQDALIQFANACGGNGAPNSFFFCTYEESADKFHITKEFGDSWLEPTIEIRNKKPAVKLIDVSTGNGYTEMNEEIKWFGLEGHQVQLIESKVTQPIKALVEITSAELDKDDGVYDKTLEVDLNGDGKMDEISARYWMRWGTLNWDVKLAGSEKVTLSGTGHRIGVLSTTTNGTHDLVNHLNEVFFWNGEAYVNENTASD